MKAEPSLAIIPRFFLPGVASAVREVEAELGEAASDEAVAEHMGLSIDAYQSLVTKLKPVMVMSGRTSIPGVFISIKI